MPADIPDVQAIEELRQRIEAAENAGDTETIASVFDADAVAMVPDFPVQEGAPACAAFIRGLLPALHEHFDRRITYVGTEVQIVGGLAFDRGEFSFTVVPRSGGTTDRVTGKYLWIYRRDPDAAWKLWRMIVTRDDPEDADSAGGGVSPRFARLAGWIARPFIALVGFFSSLTNRRD